MTIGVGSENQAKISACQTALKKLRQAFYSDRPVTFDVIPLPTQTDVPEMPLSRDDIIRGARMRALQVYKKLGQPDYAIGLEGGVFRLGNDAGHASQAFLNNWVYIYNGQQGFYGSSPALPLPAAIEQALYQQKRELAEIIDTFSGRSDVRSKEGAFGVLTRDLITRSLSFETAVISAFVPFLNNTYYNSGTEYGL